MENIISLQCKRLDAVLKTTAIILKNTQSGNISLGTSIHSSLIAMVKSYLTTNTAARNMRKTMNECADTCHGTEAEAACMKVFMDFAVKIRNNYADIADIISKSRLSSFFLGKITDRALAQWDDLVEDFNIGNDPEFRDLIYKIAEAA